MILVLLSDPTQTVEFAWRPQDSGAFTPVNPADPHVTVQARTNHVLLRIDLAAFPTPIPLGTYWSVRRLGPGDALNTDNVHVMTDLHVQAEMYFGADRHFIEEPVEINCRIMAGGQPVTDAEVLIDVARPGESLGTFLATNSGRYKEVQNRKPQGPDPDTDKGHMISTVLSLLEMDALPVIPAPDFVLHDDGAHGDGPAGNGVWANSFTDTALEGAYSFRFRVRGKLANGSIFTRTILKTIYHP